MQRYIELNLIPFSRILSESKKENGDVKKKLENLPSHKAITKYSNNLIRTYNGLSIKTGTKLPDGSYTILVDVDNKNETMTKWERIVKTHNKSLQFKTPTAQTGNKRITLFI